MSTGGIGAKLSRHVLGMKFMRKTKDQFDKERVEKVHREHFAPSPTSAGGVSVKAELKSEPSVTSATTAGIEELWSYNQCERYIFGRQSYGGFNPTVELNVKKGIWKPFYLDEAETPNNESDDEDDTKKQSDVDVSDEEMAKTYGSLIGTLAKHFQRKHKREAEEEEMEEASENDDQVDDEVVEAEAKNKPNKRKRWNKGFKNNRNQVNSNPNQHQNQAQKSKWKGNDRKRQQVATGSAQVNEKSFGKGQGKKSRFSTRSRNQEEVGPPPSKKKKFMKPSDD